MHSESVKSSGLNPKHLMGAYVALGLLLVGSLVGIVVMSSKISGLGDVSSAVAMRNICFALLGISSALLPGLYFYNRLSQQREAAENSLGELEKSYGEQLASLAFAQAETDRIMETVQEGLFLVDREGYIGHYHSREAPVILRCQELAGANLFEILRQHLSEKMYKTSRDFFDLLFDATRKERTVLSVNPLTDIEVNFPNPDGGFITRYLGFSFRRILVDGQVDRLFVALRDVTKQVELEHQLRDADKTKEREMHVLLSIVHIPHEELEAFVKLAQDEMDTINNALRAEDFASSTGRNDELRAKLQTVYRSVHNLNGNAALLNLTHFQRSAFEFETKIKELLARKVLSGDDFLSVVIAQAALKGNLTDLQNLRNQLGNNLNLVASPARQEAPGSTLTPHLRQLVEKASADLGKSASLTVDEYALHAFSQGRTDLMRDVLVQLIRNSVAHGVEPEETRLASGKDPVAKISIHALPALSPGVHGLAVRDDGRGLDLERIRQRAEQVGLLTADDQVNTQQIIQCIFESGFSTTDEADLHSGRGVGVDIVRSKFVDEAGGLIEVHSEPGQFCEFRLYMPS